MGPSLPKIVDAILLPFKNRIIYDGTLSSFNIIFGSDIRRSIDDSYRQAKSTGIMTTLHDIDVGRCQIANRFRMLTKRISRTEYSRDVQLMREIRELIGRMLFVSPP